MVQKFIISRKAEMMRSYEPMCLFNVTCYKRTYASSFLKTYWHMSAPSSLRQEPRRFFEAYAKRLAHEEK